MTESSLPVFFSVGSNVDAERNLQLAVRELRRRFGELTLSPVYRNAAVGFDGDDFLNMAIGARTELSVTALQGEIEAVHAIAGRQRVDARFVARTLDIDLLLYGDLVTSGPPATLPRPDVLRYSFVLKPLTDIAPDLSHPVSGRALAEHWADLRNDPHELTQVPLPFDSPTSPDCDPRPRLRSAP